MVDVNGQLKEYIYNLPDELLEITDSIYLYGSMARGDTSEDSDCDLLIAIDDCSEEVFMRIKDATSKWHPELKCEIALYQMSALKAMQEKGSLFLWHIKTEAHIIYAKGNRLAQLLSELAEYRGSKEALIEYYDIMEDITGDITDDIRVLQYNLSVMATLIRNSCIICCYLIGDKHFGRVSPVKICSEYFQNEFPMTIEEYEQLYQYRIAVNRGGNMPNIPNLACYYSNWKYKTCRLLKLAFLLVE